MKVASNLFKSQAKSLRRNQNPKIRLVDGTMIDLSTSNRQSLMKNGSTLQELPSLQLNISNGQAVHSRDLLAQNNLHQQLGAVNRSSSLGMTLDPTPGKHQAMKVSGSPRIQLNALMNNVSRDDLSLSPPRGVGLVPTSDIRSKMNSSKTSTTQRAIIEETRRMVQNRNIVQKANLSKSTVENDAQYIGKGITMDPGSAKKGLFSG